MKLLVCIACLEFLFFSCCSVNNYNSDNTMKQIIIERKVRYFSEIPLELLNNFEKIGVDNSSTLNEYEGKYLNVIFNTETNDFQLVNKRIGFLGSKKDFFKDEKEWYYRGEKTGVGGAASYMFNSEQKAESGGYDGAIVYWSKFVLPTENVIARLKKQQ